MGYTLRPYQSDAVVSTLNAFREGAKSVLVVWPTGLGKTVLVSGVVEKVVKNGGKVLFLAHRNRLVEQGADKIGCEGSVTYSTIQSMSRDETLASYGKGEFNLIVVDETHHIPSATYQKVTSYFGRARLFGVTATPVRGDGADVTDLFEKVSSEYTLSNAIKDGYLCPLKIQTCPVTIDVSSVSTNCGDYSVGEIGEALLPYLSEVSKQIIKRAENRKTVIFTPLVSTARGMTELIRSLGGSADYVSGDRADSDAVLEAYHRGEFQFLLNSMLLTEGYDEPGISCVVNLRITRSEALATQIIGRGTRLCPEQDKKDCLVLDFIWRDKEKRKRLSPVAAVMAGSGLSDEEYEGMCSVLAESTYDEPTDVFDAAKVAEQSAKDIREAALARELKDAAAKERLAKKQEEERAQVSSRFNEICDALGDSGQWISKSEKLSVCSNGDYLAIRVKDPALSAMKLSDYCVPNSAWMNEPPTESQMKALQRFRIPGDVVYSKAHASYLLDGLFSRQKERLASYGQIKTLLRYKVPSPENIPQAKAKAALDILAKNGWKWSDEIKKVII